MLEPMRRFLAFLALWAPGAFGSCDSSAPCGDEDAALLLQSGTKMQVSIDRRRANSSGCEGIPEAMGRGINIGNTYDYEGFDRDPEAVKTRIKWAKDQGFRHVRIPVTWGQYFDPDSELTKNVTEVVDYALELGLYAIINTHHEAWLKEGYYGEQMPDLKDKFWNLWIGIASQFANKSSKLLSFEILNEPDEQFGDWDHEPQPFDETAIDKVRDINGAGYAAVRSIPGNEERMVWLHPNAKSNKRMAREIYPTIWSLPGGGEDECVGVTIHTYDPYDFCGENGHIDYYPTIEAMKKDLVNQYQDIRDWAFDSHIPVYVGEFGVGRQTDQQHQRDTDLVREYYKFTSNHLRSCGFGVAAWDDPGWFQLYTAPEYDLHSSVVETYD